VAGWEATGLEPDQAGSVFALIAGHGYPIKWERPATISVALNVALRWLEVKSIR